MPKPVPKKKKAPTLSKLKAKLWGLVSVYVRSYYALPNGQCRCYTCEKWYPAFGPGCIQAGHLFPRNRLATCFDLDNIRPQCYGCNVAQKGNYAVYHPKMMAELGVEKYEQLRVKSLQPVKVSRQAYELLIAHYQEMVDHVHAVGAVLY